MDPAILKGFCVLLTSLLGAFTSLSLLLMSRRKRYMFRQRLLLAISESQGECDPLLLMNPFHTSFRTRSMLRSHLGVMPRQRRWWVRHRAVRTWWEDEVLATWDDGQWLANFRMTRATLFEIADHLRNQLQKSDSSMRKSIPVEKRVGMTVWWLTTPLNYRKTAIIFGVGVSTVHRIVLEVCKAIEDIILPAVVCLGDHHEDRNPQLHFGMRLFTLP